ncbi:MAG: GlmU family protein [Bacteroidota bacterium]
MNNIILFDDESRDHLLPLTFTRPVSELRIGILKTSEKWAKYLDGQVSFITQDYLSEKFPLHIEDDNFVVNGAVLPTERLCRLIKQLETNEALLLDGELIAARLNKKQFDHLMKEEEIEELSGFELEDTPFIKINNSWDIFSHNDEAIRQDFELLTKGRESAPISQSNQIINPEQIFLEEGASVECAILNAATGPIYVGKEAQILEGAMVRGPLAMCEKAILKMGAKVYGATTVGPYSKIGGEVNNVVVTGYSSKGHEGFLGNSVLGEWCNIGADSNSSNLKNNYAPVRLWDYSVGRFAPTGLQFCGLIMGDHSKCGINTMFNTGTVVGVFANIFGSGYPRNFIPSFSWGGTSGYSTYRTTKAFETAERVTKRRQKDFEEVDQKILEHVFNLTSTYRPWEKVHLQ